MLSSDALANILLAIATGYPDRAVEVVATSDEIDEEAREVLGQALTIDNDRSACARRFGDGLRSLGADRDLVNECYRVAFYVGDDWKTLLSNPLYAFHAANKGGSSLDKWVHYFAIYERHLARYRGLPVRVLEIGVYRGGGLDLLRQYLGPEAHLVGVDIDEAARLAVGPRYSVELGDQADPEFMRRVSDEHGPFDVVIDDGGHTMRQQIVSVETLFPLLSDGATYIVEDCHTSYWPEYSDQEPGGLTFLAWTRQRIDDLHAYHFSREKDLSVPWQTDLIGLHIYDSVVVLDKGYRAAPFCELSGTKEFINYNRLAAATELELIATRDAAVAQAARVTAEVEARSAEVEARSAEVEAQAAEMGAFRSEMLDAADDLVELRDELAYEMLELRDELSDLQQEVADKSEQLEQTRIDLHGAWGIIRVMRRSKSWKLTAPLRAVKNILRRS